MEHPEAEFDRTRTAEGIEGPVHSNEYRMEVLKSKRVVKTREIGSTLHCPTRENSAIYSPSFIRES
jgi:hypothetical protein